MGTIVAPRSSRERSATPVSRVVYTGLHQTPEQIVQAVIQRTPTPWGSRCFPGAHLVLVPRVIDLLKSEGREDVLLLVGGIIPTTTSPVSRPWVSPGLHAGASLAEIGTWLESTLDAREHLH